MCFKDMNDDRSVDSKTCNLSVCIVTPAMTPIVGGAETFSEVLVLSLISKGIKIFLVTAYKPSDDVSNKIMSSGGKVYALGDEFSINDGYVAWEWAAFSRAKAIHQILESNEIDIIHALSHDCILAASIALEDSRFKEKIPLVVTTSEMSTEDTRFGQARSRFIYNLNIAGLIQLSQYYYKIAVSYGCKPKKSIISAAVDIDLFQTGIRSKGRKYLELPEDIFLILCPSRFSRRKGQIDLLKALQKISSKYKNIVCLLAGGTNSGSQDYLNEVRDWINKSQIICLIKEISRNFMPHIYAASDLVVLPSYKEGLGFAAIEGMAAERPVLLSEVSGFDEIPDGNEQVEYFESGNIDMLAEKIEMLIGDEKKRKRIAKLGKQSVEKRFSMKKFGEDVVQLYKDLNDKQEKR